MAKPVSTLQDRVRDLKDRSLESVADAKDHVVTESKHAAMRIDREAHRSPWKFVGIAAFFTAFFAFFLGRKSK